MFSGAHCEALESSLRLSGALCEALVGFGMADRPTNRPTDRPIDRPTNRPTDRFIDRPTDRNLLRGATFLKNM